MMYPVLWSTLLIHLVHSYNLVPHAAKELKSEASEPDDLFGWSLAGWKDQIIVGSPGQSGTGAVFMCYKYREDYCLKLPGPELPPKGFFGSMLAADDYDLFSCAPLAFLESYGVKQPNGKKDYTTGVCYKMNHNKFQVQAMFNMSSLGSNQFGNRFAGAYNKWYRGSMYGVSGVVLDRTLVIGAPLQKDKVTAKKADVYSGTVVMIENKRIVEVDPGKANFALKLEEVDTGVIHNLAGESVIAGDFTKDGSSQLLIGAPKADFLHGKVYICGECFHPVQGRNVDLPDGKNIEITGEKAGERFGKSVIGCDITGDGLDDVIVGAPLSSSSKHEFDTGKIYVYILKGDKLEKGIPASITPDQEFNGGRFGDSLGCLGDIDNDALEDIIVGAPYYKENGAVFIYYGSPQGIQIDRKPQIIHGKDIKFMPQGFGISVLALPQDSVAIGAHLSNQVAMINARKVLRFQANSKLLSRRSMIDMSKGEEEELITVQTLLRFSDSKVKAPGNLIVQLSFNIDKRLKPVQSKVFSVFQDQYPNIEETFSFEALEKSFGHNFDSLREFPLPIKIQAIVQWTLVIKDECKGNLTSANCPMLDPKDKSLQTEFLSLSIPFRGGCSDTGCQCMLQMYLGTTSYTVVSGAEDSGKTDLITIINVGNEVAYGINITVDTSSEVDIGVTIDACERAGKKLFACPAIKALDRLQFRVHFDTPANMDAKDATAVIEVGHKCVNQQQQENLPTRLEIKLKLEKRHQLVLAGLKDLSNSFVSVKKKSENVFFNHTYSIANMGPSLLVSLQFYAAVEKRNVKVCVPSVIGAECQELVGGVQTDLAKQILIGQAGDVCVEQEDCLFFKCRTEKIAKGENLTVTFNMEIEDKDSLDFLHSSSPSVQSFILVIPDEEISTKIGASKLSFKSEFLQIVRKSKISTSIVPELSANYLLIGKKNEKLDFFHTFKVRNDGPSNLNDFDFYLTVTAVDVVEFNVEIIDTDCRAADVVHPESDDNTCQESENCLFFFCNIGRIQKNEHQILKIKLSIQDLKTREEEDSKGFIESAVKIPNYIDDEKEEYKYTTIHFRTDFSQPTIVQKIIDHWYVVAGIIIGLIIICIAVAVLFKFDVFNKVRIYREEIDIIHSARNSRLRGSEVAEEVNRNVFINRGNNMEEEVTEFNGVEMKEIMSHND